MKQKITVIGGSGFVGTNFCQRLFEKGLDFEILDVKRSNRFPAQSKIADVRDVSSLRQAMSGDVVVNLAAVHRDDIWDKSEYYTTNVEGAKNVAKICTEKEITKIIFTSSVAVYGHTTYETSEDGATNPFNEYGKTKLLAENELREWNNARANSLIIVRPTVIFGEGNRGNVYNLLRQIATDRFVMVGNGKNRKSMAYIQNVVTFLEYCVEENTKYALYIYADKPDYDMDTLVSQVKKVLGKKQNLQLRIPYFVGLLLGYLADGYMFLTKNKLALSSVRVRKFCSESQFSSKETILDNFAPPYSLQEALDKTVSAEFLQTDPDRETFETE